MVRLCFSRVNAGAYPTSKARGRPSAPNLQTNTPMSEDNGSTPGKKHRVIHWNPDTGVAPDRRRWSWQRIVLWSVGGFFALLFTAGIVIRVIKLVAPDVFSSQAQLAGADEAADRDDPNATFITQSKAEFAYEKASKALADLRRIPQDHPVQTEKLVLIEKAFRAGEPLVQDHEYNQAFRHFSELNREIDEFARSVK